jgi:hypothetical protein
MLDQCDAHEMAEGNSDNHKKHALQDSDINTMAVPFAKGLSCSDDGKPSVTIQIVTERKKSHGCCCLHSNSLLQ